MTCYKLAAPDRAAAFQSERKQVAVSLKRLKAEMEQLRGRRRSQDQRAKQIDQRVQDGVDSRTAPERLEQSCRKGAQGLDTLGFEERQRLARLVVERVSVENGRVRTRTVICVTVIPSAVSRSPDPERSEGEWGGISPGAARSQAAAEAAPLLELRA